MINETTTLVRLLSKFLSEASVKAETLISCWNGRSLRVELQQRMTGLLSRLTCQEKGRAAVQVLSWGHLTCTTPDLRLSGSIQIGFCFDTRVIRMSPLLSPSPSGAPFSRPFFRFLSFRSHPPIAPASTPLSPCLLNLSFLLHVWYCPFLPVVPCALSPLLASVQLRLLLHYPTRLIAPLFPPWSVVLPCRRSRRFTCGRTTTARRWQPWTF